MKIIIIMSTSGIYNYHPKVEHPNAILPQMSSDGNRPFYFGASQIPINLGIDNNINIKNKYDSSINDINSIHMKGNGLGLGLKTTMKKSNNIKLAKYMFHK